MKEDLLKKFSQNLSYAFAAQFVSLVSSAVMSLVVSKALGIEHFSYWQLFIFYTTYVGLFHFGLSDGVYLRYGGAERNSLDYSVLGSQLKYMNIVHGFLALIISLGALFFCDDIYRAYAWIFAAIYLLLANILYYIGFIFQAINETKIYSIAIIISKASFLLFALALIILRIDTYIPFAILYLISQLLGTLFLVNKGNILYKTSLLPIKSVFPEIWKNITIGINLTISSVASSLILGIGRIIVDINGGLTDFGIVSLAISLTSFVLNFLAQVSLALFPMLRKFNKEKIADIYSSFSSFLSYLLCIAFVLFIPFKYVLELWLPNYSQSFTYMIFLFPICIFDGKMQMLYNTYLKVLRKEKKLLLINIASMLTSCVLCAISVLLFENIIATVLAMVIAIVMRSIVSSMYLSKTLSVKFEKNIISEIILSVIFIYCNLKMSIIPAFLIILLSVAFYCATGYKNIHKFMLQIKIVRG